MVKIYYFVNYLLVNFLVNFILYRLIFFKIGDRKLDKIIIISI